jgi:hypothetical protein
MDRRSGINTALKSQKSALLGSRSHYMHDKNAENFNLRLSNNQNVAKYSHEANT